MSEEEKVEPRIVEAVASASSRSTVSNGGSGKSPLAQLIEMAMSEAVKECYANNVTDPEKIKAAMLDARERVKKWFEEQMDKVTREGNKQG